jgi:hypothetical protein
LLNWDNMSSQVGPGRTVTITSEKTKKQNNWLKIRVTNRYFCNHIKKVWWKVYFG